VNFAGGAVVLIFTVELFHSAIRHREAHSCALPLSPGWRNVSLPDNDALVVDVVNITSKSRRCKVDL
jgi:hypothetical protein